MGILDRTLQNMTQADIERLIRLEVAKQIPAIPTGVLSLSDSAVPLVPPPSSTVTDGQALVFDPATSAWVAGDPAHSGSVGDGNAPGSSPTPTIIGGPTFITATWTAASGTTDTIFYDVYCDSSGSSFTPGSGNFIASVPGTALVIKALHGGTALVYGTTYYVRLIARDQDGSAAAGTAGSGTMVQIDGGADILANSIVAADIAANTITANEIAAATIDATLLESNLVLASTITAGDPSSSHVEMGLSSSGDGSEGFSAFGIDGATKTFDINAATGEVLVVGRVDFGTGSKIRSDDIIELYPQVSSGFQTPAVVQHANVSKGVSIGSSLTGISANYDSPTTTGNFLLAVITSGAATGGTTPNDVNTPSGWSKLGTVAGANNLRHTIFSIATAATHTGIAITWTGTSHAQEAILQIFEFSGADVVDITTTSATGTTSAPASNATGTLAVANELAIGIVSEFGTGLFATSPGAATGGFSNYATTYDEYTISTSPNTQRTIFQTISKQVVSATTSLTLGYSAVGASTWCATVVTVKSKAAGAATPDSGQTHLYSRSVTSTNSLHTICDDGNAGSLVMAPAGTRWRMEHQTIAIDVPSTAGNTAITPISVSVSPLAVGDLCFYVGCDLGTQRFIFQTANPCATLNTIVLNGYNADPSTRDPSSTNFHFLVIHTS